MPSGWFERDNSPFAGHPFVRGIVRFPRLGLIRRVDFLVDTGCGVTTILPRDSSAMGLDFDMLRESGVAVGIGGTQIEYNEEAEISFFHGVNLVTYLKEIDISPVTGYNTRLPSLLGMDVIRHWRMTCDVRNGEVEFDIHEADTVQELGTTP